jgi:hypothetical protein
MRGSDVSNAIRRVKAAQSSGGIKSGSEGGRGRANHDSTNEQTSNGVHIGSIRKCPVENAMRWEDALSSRLPMRARRNIVPILSGSGKFTRVRASQVLRWSFTTSHSYPLGNGVKILPYRLVAPAICIPHSAEWNVRPICVFEFCHWTWHSPIAASEDFMG